MALNKEMKVLVQLFFLLSLSIYSRGQTDVSYGMTSVNNAEWLTKLKTSDKESKLNLVKERLVQNRRILDPNDKLDVPVLIIDGIFIADRIDRRTSEFLINELTAEMVDIQVLEKEPEGVYINKAFTGIVLLTITDRKASKKFKKLK
jgi:hypothetical protein